MLVLSPQAFILSIFPFVSALGNLRGIKRLLEQAKTTARPHDHNYEGVNPMSQTEGEQTSFRGHLMQNTTVQVITSYVKFLSLTHLVHALLVMYGIAILGISVASSDLHNTFQPTPYDCQHRVYPWLSTKEACAGRVINCTKAGILGQSTEITTALLVFDESTLSSLTFTECPALEFPRTVQLFKGLTVLNVYNSAIVEWSADFALTGSLFPLIQTVRLWYVDLQCSPDGFYKYRLSPSLEWISFYDIDVTGFIHEVGDHWVNLKLST